MFKNHSRLIISLDSFWLFCFSISLYFNAYFFVMWGSYPFQALSLFCKVFSYFGGFCLIFFSIRKNGVAYVVNKKELLALFVAVIFIFSINCMGSEIKHYINIGHIWMLIQLFFLIRLEKHYKLIIFKYMAWIFAISIIPSLICFLLSLVGIEIPYSVMYGASENKTMVGAYYRHYPFGLVIYQAGSLARYCGVFDEPGVIGTLSAIFFSAINKDKDKKLAILLIIEGVFSFSMAFFLLIIVYYLVNSIIKGAFRFALVCVAVFVFLNVFINANFQNEYLRKIQSRIDTTSFILVQDNRTTDSFDNEYEAFINEGGFALIMGKGQGAVESNALMTASSSYKKLVYNYGIIGCILMISVFVLMVRAHGWNKKYLPFLVVFLISTYQRPYVFTTEYLSIFIGALAYMYINKTDQLEHVDERTCY